MKVIGHDELMMYNESHFIRQQPSDEKKWQDSTWMQWWDLENKLGGVHRIGHEYNIEGGPKVALWSNLITPKGIYKRVLYQTLREADKLPNGWGGGDDTCRNVFENGLHVWIIDDPEAGVSATLKFKDYHQAFMGFPVSGRHYEDLAPDHLDIGGSVTGMITMQGTTFEANGMGMRDHGWGHRHFNVMLSHRYVTGTFGPALTFCACVTHNGVDDSIEAFGWAVKDTDTVIFAEDIDVITYAEVDSASTRGGHIMMKLADGEVLDCELIAEAPGLVNSFHVVPNNTCCRANCNGREGVGTFESSMNFHQGKRPTGKMQNAIVANGFYPGPFEPWGNTNNSVFLAKRML